MYYYYLQNSKGSDGATYAKGGDAEKKVENENQLKRTKSRELRGGVMYYSCHCIKRNGLQHDCRRTGCGGEPTCLTLPDPVCAPSQLARARGLADPGPLAQHIQAASGGSGTSGQMNPGSSSGGSGGKRFVVCELKSISPNVTQNSPSAKCCKFPNTKVPNLLENNKCVCPNHSMDSDALINTLSPAMNLDNVVYSVIECLESKDTVEINENKLSRNNQSRGKAKPLNKEEPCTRPNCQHWRPPPPCVWDAPCKADCFETPPGIQPGRNPLRF